MKKISLWAAIGMAALVLVYLFELIRSIVRLATYDGDIVWQLPSLATMLVVLVSSVFFALFFFAFYRKVRA